MKEVLTPMVRDIVATYDDRYCTTVLAQQSQNVFLEATELRRVELRLVLTRRCTFRKFGPKASATPGAEESQRDTQAFYNHLVELNPQTVWILGPDGRNLDVSPRWERMFESTGEHA